MKINYKYTTIALALALILTYSWHWNDIFNHGNKTLGMNNMAMTHQMPDGSMMTSDKTMVKNTQMNMNSMMGDMLANMEGKTGTELEKVFLQEMIVHHQGAVDMATALLKDKTIRPELAKFAQDIITAQTAEISMQKKWLKNWYGIIR